MEVHSRVIEDHIADLVDKINPSSSKLCDILVQKGVISMADMNYIKQKHLTDRDLVREILHTVKNGSRDTFEKFLAALEESGQKHISADLQKWAAACEEKAKHTQEEDETPPTLQGKDLECVLNLDVQDLDPVGLFALEEGGCLLGSMKQVVQLDDQGKRVGGYPTENEGEDKVGDFSRYGTTLFMIQSSSVTAIRNFTGTLKGDEDSEWYEVGDLRLDKLEFMDLRGGVAITEDTLFLAEDEKIIQYKLGEEDKRVMVSDLEGAYKVRVFGIGENRRFVVADHFGHCIKIYDQNWKLLHKIRGDDSKDFQLHSPWDIAVTEDGSIYVSDTSCGIISQFNIDGQFISIVLTSGQIGGIPHNIAISQQYLWVRAYVDNDKAQGPSSIQKLMKYKLDEIK